MENRTINIAVVAEVAEALKDIKDQMVFVGGAVVSLYTDDPAADEIRPTQDIDMTLNIVNLSHWEKVQEQLGALGFHPDPFGHSICSYKYKDIPLDIMATEDGSIGPANRWYKIGFDNLWTAKAKEQEVSILSAPCFLATKFEAFKDRGSDYRTSHDIEDIIYVLDNRMGIVEEIKKDDPRIANFIKEQLQKIISKGMMQEVLMAHIHTLMLEERLPIVEEKSTKYSINPMAFNELNSVEHFIIHQLSGVNLNAAGMKEGKVGYGVYSGDIVPVIPEHTVPLFHEVFRGKSYTKSAF